MLMIDEDQSLVYKLVDWPTITDKINSKIPNTPNYFNNPSRKRDPKTNKILLEDDK